MARKADGEGSVRQLKDGTWECVIQSKYINPESKGANPKRIKRRGPTEQDAIKSAKQALKAWEKQYERNEFEKVNTRKTFGQYMEDFLEKEVKPNIAGSTYLSYNQHLILEFYGRKISNLTLSQLNTVEFEVYYDSLFNEKSAKTVLNTIQLTKRCCKWLYSRSLIPEDYAEFAKTKREKRDEFFRDKEVVQHKKVYSYDDIRKFYDAYKNGISEYAGAIILMLETLMRSQELFALTIDDVDFENNTINIRSAVSRRYTNNDSSQKTEAYIKVPKNTEARQIYMTPLAREVIEYMISQAKLKCRNNPQNLVFPSYHKHGKPRSVSSFEVQLKDLCNKLGIDRDVHQVGNTKKGLCVHSIRHTAITIANTAPGANVVNTALMAGHNAVRTENIYTHTNVEAMKSVRTASDEVLGLNKEESKADKDAELYEMYLKLKEMFEK